MSLPPGGRASRTAPHPQRDTERSGGYPCQAPRAARVLERDSGVRPVRPYTPWVLEVAGSNPALPTVFPGDSSEVEREPENAWPRHSDAGIPPTLNSCRKCGGKCRRASRADPGWLSSVTTFSGNSEGAGVTHYVAWFFNSTG